jgi:gliding motility-associated-like protein
MSLPLFIPKLIYTWRQMKGIENVLKRVIGLVYFLSLSTAVFSQSCPHGIKNPWQWPSHSNWIIGNGIKAKFASGGVTVSSLPNIKTYEGSSGASDDWGNLLFLTNGRLVWDAQGNQKFSGLLEGDEGGSTSPNGSASQGVITVRHPLDTANYYIFTTDDVLTGSPYGFNYCVVDRNGNGKSGPTRLGTYRTTEGIAATRHANGVDIWVTVCASNSTNFYTYLITCAGVVKTPVISSVAVAKKGDQERGGLAFSWDSKYFVQAHPDYYPNSDKEVSVYKFDNQTGIISDAHHISDAGTVDSPYDVTFSPDNTKIYFSTPTGALGCYDISSWNTATMTASFKFVKGVNTGSYGAIEIGVDGNLYMAARFAAMGKVSGDLNGGGNLSYTAVPGAITNLGLPTMYLPPYEEPDILEAGPYCPTDPPVDLSTNWICSGINAEDPVLYPNSYSGTGITDKGKGTFDPAIAGIGNHMIIFKRCSVDDTIFITVKACICPDTTLKAMPPLCIVDSMDLNKYKSTAEPGTWSIVSTPSSSTATLAGSIFYTNNTVPGNYTVRFTLNKKVAGCPEFAERIIRIHPRPIVTATAEKMNCNGQSVLCSANGATNYAWSNGGFGVSITVTPLATTTYTVTGTDANGCVDTSQVTVVVPPKLELIAQVTNVNCLGNDNGTASVTASGGTPGYAYAWSNGQTIPMITGLPPGSYTVVVMDANKCLDSTSVLVGAPVFPRADFTFSTGCKGTPVEFIENSTAGNGNTIVSYKWDFGDPANLPNVDYTQSPAPHLYTSTGTYTVKLVVITDGGCADSISKTIDIWPVPVVDFGSPKIGCRPVCVDFVDLSTISTGSIVKWNWSFGDGSSGNNSSAEKNPKHCYNKSGIYDVTLTVVSDKGCKATLQKKNLIEVLASPVAAFTSDVKEAEIFKPIIRFFDQSSGSPVSWHWDFGVSTLTTDTSVVLNPTWTYTDTGKYNVCLTVKNNIGCSDYVCHPITITPFWTFYIPNAFTPDGDGINDFFNGKGFNILEYQLWIYDRWGNMIYTTGKANNPESSTSWDGKANNGEEAAQQDVYVWKVQLKDVFKKSHSYTGTVTIVK